jgi:hypothetical protein
MTGKKDYLIYFVAIVVGIVVEILGIRFEGVMMRMNLSARVGFLISLFLLIFSPFFTTGVIVYKLTGELMKGVVLSALVFALSLIILLI